MDRGWARYGPSLCPGHLLFVPVTVSLTLPDHIEGSDGYLPSDDTRCTHLTQRGGPTSAAALPAQLSASALYSLLRCWRGDLQQGLLHDFSEGRVDVERVVGKLIDRLSKAHGVDERLQQDGGVRPDEMRPQHLARFGVGNELHKTLRVPDGPTVRCGAVCSLANHIRQTLLLHLPLGQPHARHLWGGKNGVRHGKVVAAALHGRMGHVIRHGTRLSVGRMLELMRTGDITQG